MVKDVQRAWLNANSGYLRLELTNDLLVQAVESPGFGASTLQTGFSEIRCMKSGAVGKSQAEIAQAKARYDYLKEPGDAGLRDRPDSVGVFSNAPTSRVRERRLHNHGKVFA